MITTIWWITSMMTTFWQILFMTPTFLADFYQDGEILRDFCTDDDFLRFISGMPTFLGDFNEDDQICLRKKTFFQIFFGITSSRKISKVLILREFLLLEHKQYVLMMNVHIPKISEIFRRMTTLYLYTFLGQSGKIHQKQSFRIWLTK